MPLVFVWLSLGLERMLLVSRARALDRPNYEFSSFSPSIVVVIKKKYFSIEISLNVP